MNIKGQEIKSKNTGEKLTIEGVKNGKVLVKIGSGDPISCSLDYLSMSDELKEELIKELNKTLGRNQILTGIAAELDHERTEEELKDAWEIDSLHKGDFLGREAKNIYTMLCHNKNFNWDITKTNNFKMMKGLHASDATLEGYSVWFLAHSSYNGSIAKSEKVYNRVEENGNIIEVWNDDIEIKTTPSMENRIVFIKNKFGQYIFWGIVKSDEVDLEKRESIHKYVSDCYMPKVID